MAALGSSPTYYDFDMFQEMKVTTGGADLQTATPGVGLNFVLKSGIEHAARFGAHLLRERGHAGEQPARRPEGDSRRRAPARATASTSTRTTAASWAGRSGRTGCGPGARTARPTSRCSRCRTRPDRTILENTSFKTTGQITQALRGGFTFFRGDKLKFGRSAGPTRPPATTWNQSGPTSLYKGEINAVVEQQPVPDRPLRLRGRRVRADPAGRSRRRRDYQDDAGIYRDSYVHYETVRPQRTVSGEGNYFQGRHEVKFGFDWRKADVESSSIVPGYPGPNGIITTHDGYPNMIADIYVGNDLTQRRRQVHERLRWRHDHVRPAHAEPRRALGPRGGLGVRDDADRQLAAADAAA